jgi:pimeloyl-ACP methyl ester carboxylesterase
MAARLLDDAPESFVLVGISMGGYIALEVVRQALGRVRALALISTSATPDTPEQADSRRRQLDLARAGRYDDIVTAAFPALVDPSHRSDAELAAFWSLTAHEVGPEAFCTQLKAVIDRPDAHPMLSTISCPTAVIHGAGDQLITLDHGQGTAARIPSATLTVVEAAGHMAAQEQPTAVGKALDALLNQAAVREPLRFN